MTRADSVHLVPDAQRVITKPFLPREEINPDGSTRMQLVLERIRAMSDGEAAETLATARALFVDRHRDIDDILERNFRVVAASLDHLELLASPLPAERRHLIGAYFTHEYSVEAAALGNPSMVPAPDQSGLEIGEVRFLMSLRAIGEGHLSSIEFRSGVVTADAEIRLDPVSDYARTGDRTPHAYDTTFFRRLLDGLGMLTETETDILIGLEDRFTMAELETRIAAHDDGSGPPITEASARVLEWLTQSNYRTSFPVSTDVSERVLFPSGPTESHGMEDARFVRFVDDDGTVTYFATYTAFDGHQILPQLIETADFTDSAVLRHCSI